MGGVIIVFSLRVFQLLPSRFCGRPATCARLIVLFETSFTWRDRPATSALALQGSLAVRALKDKEDPAEVQTVSQKQLDERLDEKLNGLEQRLMNKLDTANTGCKCAIA